MCIRSASASVHASCKSPSAAPEDAEWYSEGDITFAVPEAVAWEIAEMAEERWPCFAPSLAEKRNAFCAAIV
jgi:hypothetical protein